MFEMTIHEGNIDIEIDQNKKIPQINSITYDKMDTTVGKIDKFEVYGPI